MSRERLEEIKNRYINDREYTELLKEYDRYHEVIEQLRYKLKYIMSHPLSKNIEKDKAFYEIDSVLKSLNRRRVKNE